MISVDRDPKELKSWNHSLLKQEKEKSVMNDNFSLIILKTTIYFFILFFYLTGTVYMN